MPDPDLPPQQERMLLRAESPSSGRVLLYAALGGFLGALLAVLVAKILAGPCCCPESAETPGADAALSSLAEFLYDPDRTLLA